MRSHVPLLAVAMGSQSNALTERNNEQSNSSLYIRKLVVVKGAKKENHRSLNVLKKSRTENNI